MTTHAFNDPALFDAVYCLSLPERKDRWALMQRRFAYQGITAERWLALHGSVVRVPWQLMLAQHAAAAAAGAAAAPKPSADGSGRVLPPFAASPNYLACAMSHLAIYRAALARGQNRVIILEDDVRLHRDSDRITREAVAAAGDTYDLLYLAWIPLVDDRSMWSYRELTYEDEGKRLVHARNFFSLMGYAISAPLMRHLLDVYEASFPSELDNYLVEHVQASPHWRCFGISPQAACSDDGFSDNSGRIEAGLMKKSISSLFASPVDYV